MIEKIKEALLRNKEKLAHNIPSPVEFHKEVSKELGFNFFAKRDDVLGIYGGNKVRKLEFLYPQIKQKDVFMFGPTGSHHVLANLIYGKDRFNFTTVLFPTYLYKSGDKYVSENTEIAKKYSSKTIFVPNILVAFAVCFTLSKIKNGFFIPPGSTSPRTSLGFVLASIEIFEDIKNGKIPEMDFIFLPAGTGGTVAGLHAGFSMCRMKSKIIGVQVVETCNKFFVKKLSGLIAKEIKKLSGISIKLEDEKLEILKGFLGKGYGYPTEEGKRAKEFFEKFGIKSELTYTAKTLAAILKMKDELKNKNVLFYNTLNSL